MSERPYPVVPEDSRFEDYQIKPRLFWAHWYFAVEQEPERYSTRVREHVREQFAALPDDVIGLDPTLRMNLESMLSASETPANIAATRTLEYSNHKHLGTS